MSVCSAPTENKRRPVGTVQRAVDHNARANQDLPQAANKKTDGQNRSVKAELVDQENKRNSIFERFPQWITTKRSVGRRLEAMKT